MHKFSVIIANRHATSISLETEFYQELSAIAKEENTTINKLVTEVDRTRNNKNLSSALRLYVLAKLKEKLNASL